MNNYSSFLFARPSFTEGMARLFDFADTLNEYNRSSEPDVVAMEADWTAVADEIMAAFEQFQQEFISKRPDTGAGHG